MIVGMNTQPTNEDAPHLVGADELARSMGWSAGSVAKAVSAGTRLLNDLDSFTKWQFLGGGKGILGGATPLEALRDGKLRQVKVAAEGFAER